MRAIHEPAVIFSLKQCQEVFEIFDTWQRCNAGKRVTDCYKGETEQSFSMPAHDFYVRGLSEVCARHEQESILYLDGQRGAWLRFGPEYGEEGQVFLGLWREVPRVVAGSHDAWTMLDGRYFIAA